MEIFSCFNLFSFFFVSLILQPSYCQQAYFDDDQVNCSANPSISKGYLCNGPQMSCQSFVTFQARPPYNSPTSIASLLGSEVSNIASVNNILSNEIIPQNKSIIVPVLCSCSGNIYRHHASYTVKKSDTYYHIARDIYQGLTTCQAMIS